MPGASMPSCPGCGKSLQWKHSFYFWNPWSFPCPYCGKLLEASRGQKVFAIAVVPLGVLLAGIPVLMERQGVWGTTGSLVFFAIVAPVLIAGAIASWPRTRFTLKATRGE
jgi:endogenous inhibitor of DNA gyrase (YacG/DUF329 family)